MKSSAATIAFYVALALAAPAQPGPGALHLTPLSNVGH